MYQVVLEKLAHVFAMYDDLVETLPEGSFSQKLGELPSNSVGQQLWCVSGARESYRIAIEGDTQFRWSCSLSGKNCELRDQLSSHLRGESDRILSLLRGLKGPSERQMGFVTDLLMHEYQHQGQLIRYLYGNKLPIPQSWKSQWHL